jgi:hypothetical protein
MPLCQLFKIDPSIINKGSLDNRLWGENRISSTNFYTIQLNIAANKVLLQCVFFGIDEKVQASHGKCGRIPQGCIKKIGKNRQLSW